MIIDDGLNEFLADKGSAPYSTADKMAAYTGSPEYLTYTTYFHHDVHVKEFTEGINPRPGSTFIDVGCCSGFTGLLLAHRGYKVTFHDFDGLGLKFVRWYSEKHNLDTDVIPYGQELPVRYDIAISLDVMEHTGNHLGYLRWITELADRAMICYPLMPFSPPHDDVLDEWIDDNAICDIVNCRYKLVDSYIAGGNRRFLVWDS